MTEKETEIENDLIDPEEIEMHLPKIEDEKSLLSLEISHNRIIFLDKPIKNKEKTHKNWKYNYWKDYRTGLEVEILDRDFWKSAELMRLVLETKKKSKALLILWVIFWFIFIFIFLIIVWNFLNKKETAPVTTPIISPVITQPQVQPQAQNIEVKQNIDNTGALDIIEDENKNKTNWDANNNQMLALDYQAQQLTLELNLAHKKIQLLQAELDERAWILAQKQQELNEKDLKIAELNSKLQNLTSNEFLLFLGSKIAQECEKNQNDYCKELYFKYITK